MKIEGEIGRFTSCNKTNWNHWVTVLTSEEFFKCFKVKHPNYFQITILCNNVEFTKSNLESFIENVIWYK